MAKSRVLAWIVASLLLSLPLPAIPAGAAGSRPPAVTPPGVESVVEGVIARTNKEPTCLVLTNGLELTVPLTVPALHPDLTPRRPIKAYYRHVGDQNVVTMIIPIQVTPGAGA